MHSSVAAETSAKRILIIEDDRAVSSALGHLLTHYGFSVTVAPTLREARERSLEKHDLLVLDVMLPDGSGLELLKKIRFSGQRSKVYILTGNTHAQVDREIRQLKPTQRFQKPFDFLEILESIRSEFPEQ